MGRSRKILLSQAARDYIDLEAAFLRRAGFDVLVASDGLHMLDMVRDHAPELCIVDLAMEGLAGDEVVARIREMHPDGGPAVMLVSPGGADSMERCLRSGADEVFAHPFLKETLLRKAAALLRIPRRVDERVLVRFEIEGLDPHHSPFFGSTVNISGGGVLLETVESLDVGSELRLGFFLPGHATRINCRSSVVRKETQEGGIHRYGLSFLEVADGDRRVIDGFVAQHD